MYEETRWLTAEEAADIAGVVPRTIHKWILAGRLPGHLLSRKNGYRIDAADLDAFLRGALAAAAARAAITHSQEARKSQGKSNADNLRFNAA